MQLSIHVYIYFFFCPQQTYGITPFANTFISMSFVISFFASFICSCNQIAKKERKETRIAFDNGMWCCSVLNECTWKINICFSLYSENTWTVTSIPFNCPGIKAYVKWVYLCMSMIIAMSSSCCCSFLSIILFLFSLSSYWITHCLGFWYWK